MFTFVPHAAALKQVTMVNNTLIAKRLDKIMQFHSLNASGLAEKLSIQRSSISHILSGRNKPSLDFILKIITEFPDVDFYWLLLGKGEFPKSNTPPTPIIETQKVTESTSKIISPPAPLSINSSNSEIEKIVLFYKDGTFSEHTPK